MHTKLPWHINKYGSVIQPGATRFSGIVVLNGFAMSGSADDVEANANTALIVRAVNNYAELIAVLQKLIALDASHDLDNAAFEEAKKVLTKAQS